MIKFGNNMHQEREKRRREFLPQRVKTLFVGESPPRGGAFFYDENSALYRAIRTAFGFDDRPEDFLNWFKEQGFYLDDLVHEPINDLSDQERKRKCREGIDALKARLIEYKPEAVVIVLKSIEDYVREAVRSSNINLDQSSIYVTPFPNAYWREAFLDEMRRIIPLLADPCHGGSMAYQTLLYETRGGIAYVTVNRPEKLNALDRKVMEELGACFAGIRDDEDVRAVILSGKPISAQEAYRIGLVNQVAAAKDLIAVAEAWARKIMANAPLAVKFAMEAVNRGCKMTEAEGEFLEATLFGLCCATADMKEGTRAFLEKRPAK